MLLTALWYGSSLLLNDLEFIISQFHSSIMWSIRTTTCSVVQFPPEFMPYVASRRSWCQMSLFASVDTTGRKIKIHFRRPWTRFPTRQYFHFRILYLRSSGQSGCLKGWASWKGGSCSRLSPMREMMGKRVISTPNLATDRSLRWGEAFLETEAENLNTTHYSAHF